MASTISRVQHNIASMNALRSYKNNNSALSKNLEKLSSGFKINRAGDDAAGLAISEKMRAQITGVSVAQKNANDGISLVQTAEGALTEVHDMLNRMTELATQSANGTYQNDVDREQLQKEIDQLRTEVNRIADSANFNGIKLLNGDLGATATESLSIKDAEAVDFTDGITVEDAAGAGAKSTFEINIDKAFSEGDKITLNFAVPQSGGGSVNTSITLTHTSGTPTPANGQFSGNTISDQLSSIKSALEACTTSLSNISTSPANTIPATSNAQVKDLFDSNGAYEVKVDADNNKLVITAKAEGETGKLSLTDVTVDDKSAEITGMTRTAGTDGTAASSGNTSGGVTQMIGTGHYTAGDKLKFEFKLGDTTNTVSATVEITQDMLNAVNDSGTDLTSQIVDKLKNTTFEDVASTKGTDESLYKVSDFFDVKANVQPGNGTTAEAGSVYINAKADVLKNIAADTFIFTDAKLAQSGSESYNSLSSLAGATSGTVTASDTDVATGGSKGKVEFAYATAKNVAIGDTFTLTGKLVDGRDFSVTLTAANTANAAKNEFAIGADMETTAGNLKTILTSGAAKVTVGTGENAEEVNASEIFTATSPTTAKMFTVDTSTAGKIVIENAAIGAAGTKGITGQITNGMLTTNEAKASGEQTLGGIDQDNAKITLTIDKEKMEYGTAVTIGSGNAAKTFELVKSADAPVTTNGNIRVVVEDLENTIQRDLVDAFRDAINNELISNYDADANDVKMPDTGSTQGVYTDWATSLGVAKGGADKRIAYAAVTTPTAAAAYRANTWTGYVNDNTNGQALNNTASTNSAPGTDDGYLASASRTAQDLADRGALAEVDGNTITLYTRNFGSEVENIGAKNPGGVSNGITLDFVNDDSGNIKLKAGDTIDINGKTYQFDTSTRNLQGDNALIKVSADAFASQDKAAIAKAIKLAVEEEDSTITARINDNNSVTLSAANVNGVFKTPKASQSLSGGGLTLQIGDTSESFNKLTVEIKDMHTKSLGLENISVLDQESAASAIDAIKNAINTVSDVRGTLGATQNRLEHTISNLGTMQENLQAAESAIRDTDVAEEMMIYTKNSILNQAAQAMLAQANQLPQGVLQLLQ